MKTAICVAVALAVLATPLLAQTPTAEMPPKHSETTGELKYEGRIEGDTIEECWTIPSLPFTDAGNTCAYLDHYDESCPYTGSISPDVVYCYSPPHDMCVSVSLCNSLYDTKVYVYEDEWTPGDPIACNDDFDCVDPPVPYTSWIEEAYMVSGHTYYIVVDGYGDSCGDYVLEVEETYCGPECEIDCVGTPEGEPTCYEGYDDQYNGGCQSETWSLIAATPEPVTICGTTGVYNYGGVTYRDTDWYLIYPCGGVPITATIDAEVPVLLAYIDLRGWCYDYEIYSYVFADVCIPTSLTEYLPEGQFAVFVAPADWLPEHACGSEYSLTIEGYTEHCDPTPAEATSWGKVKALYR